MYQKAIWMIECEKLAELLNGPLRSRVLREMAMQNPTRTDLHGYEDIQYSESCSHRHEKVTADDGFGMVLHECFQLWLELPRGRAVVKYFVRFAARLGGLARASCFRRNKFSATKVARPENTNLKNVSNILILRVFVASTTS